MQYRLSPPPKHGLADRRLGEEDYALEFEEPALATLGFAYEERGHLSGGAYHAILRKVDGWLPGPLRDALPVRKERAQHLLELDAAISTAIDGLKQRGLTSPYLRTFVVARVNPLRFIKGEPPSIDELLDTMTKRVRGMNLDKIKSQDIARTGQLPSRLANDGSRPASRWSAASARPPAPTPRHQSRSRRPCLFPLLSPCYLIATTSTLPRFSRTLTATSWSERSNRRSMVAPPTSR